MPGLISLVQVKLIVRIQLIIMKRLDKNVALNGFLIQTRRRGLVVPRVVVLRKALKSIPGLHYRVIRVHQLCRYRPNTVVNTVMRLSLQQILQRRGDVLRSGDLDDSH